MSGCAATGIPKVGVGRMLVCARMRRIVAVGALIVLGSTTACSEPTGSVELAWVFVDRDGSPVFPGGVFSTEDEPSSCDLPGEVTGMAVDYDLRVELTVCDPACAAGCDAEECQVIPRRTFACNDARGNEPDVPASDEPYRFTVRAVIDAPSVPLSCRDATCLAVPAPRERVVDAGRTVDLAVYQIAIDTDHQGGQRLDLGACDCA